MQAVKKLKIANESLSINMRTAVCLLELFLVAIILAFLATFATGTTEMRLPDYESKTLQRT